MLRNIQNGAGSIVVSSGKLWPRPTYRTQRMLWGYIFLLPWLFGMVFFIGGPILASFALSFTKYDVVSRPEFIGLENYAHAFSGSDDLFWSSLGRTFYYALVFVPLGLVGSLMLAILLNQGLKGNSFFRTFFFIPHLTPSVAVAILWIWILHPQVGPANLVLDTLGLPTLGWLTDRTTAIPSLIIVSLWWHTGGNQMIIFLAGLQGVPEELYDAALVDGANVFRRFWHVTLPMISPTMLFNLILGIIGALNVFALAFVATEGGPNWATWFYALHLYRQSFEYFQMGYAATLAWILAAIMMLLTYVQIKLSGRWVYYEGG